MRLRDFINDKWLLIIGIPLVGFIMPLIFNRFSFQFLFSEGYRNMVMSVATTIIIWLGIRKIVITLWERHPWEKNPWRHLIYEVILVTIYTSMVGFLSYLVYVNTDFVTLAEDFDLVPSIAITLLVTYLITCIHEAWFFFTQWNISLVKAQTLEKENLQSQYETLKSQINPHFLFNTLNTLATLIEENQTIAVRYVENTADFLRNILNLKDKEVITLEEEFGIIRMFYTLQQQRYGSNLELTITSAEKNLSMLLPPLSLQMLVENAIKHNVISSERPLRIIIDAQQPHQVRVSNNLQKKNTGKSSNGIGLQNIRNRYDLLSNQKVWIRQTDEVFEVVLPLLEAE